MDPKDYYNFIQLKKDYFKLWSVHDRLLKDLEYFAKILEPQDLHVLREYVIDSVKNDMTHLAYKKWLKEIE